VARLGSIRGSILVSSGLSCKYYTRVEVTDGGKHYIFTIIDITKITAVKSFIVQARGFRSTAYLIFTNERESTINRALDGSTYLG
jgi:hypothetical protein